MADLRERDGSVDIVDSDERVLASFKNGAIATRDASGNPVWSNSGSSAALASVASRTIPNNNTTLSDGTTQGGTARLMHVALCSFHGPRLAFSNYYNPNGNEADGANAITIAAAIEVSGNVFPVTFNGSLTTVVSPGANVVSDPLGLYFGKGTSFYTRTFVQVSAGQTFPTGASITNQGGATLEGHNYPGTASVGANLTSEGSGTVTSLSGRNVFGPSAVLAYPVSPSDARTILVVGDSIISGTGENDTNFTQWGFLLRALNNRWPYLRISYTGEGTSTWLGFGGSRARRRAALADWVKPSAIVCNLGVNDIKAGSTTVQADLLSLWQRLATFNVPIYQTTITPVTTSTDSWATTGNQTVTANEAKRVAANTYIRTVPSPLAGIIELADVAETARNSGIWNATWTTDGTHPSSVGHIALAAAVNTGLFGSQSS